MKKIASSPDMASALSSRHVPARPSSRLESSQPWKPFLARTELTGPQRLLMQAAFGPDADAAWRRWCSTTDFDDLSLAAQRLMPRIHERPDVDSGSDARIHGLYRRSRYLNRMLLQALAELAGNLTDRGIACVAVGAVPAVLGGAPYPLDCVHLAVADTSAADAPSAYGWIPERSGFERELLVRSLGYAHAELRLRLHCRPAGDNDFWRDVAPIGWEGATIIVPAPARQLIDAVAPADGWWKTPYPEGKPRVCPPCPPRSILDPVAVQQSGPTFRHPTNPSPTVSRPLVSVRRTAPACPTRARDEAIASSRAFDVVFPKRDLHGADASGR
jgi:hypothetical protein